MSVPRVFGSAVLATVAFAAGAVWAQTEPPFAKIFLAQVAALNAQDAAKYAATYADRAIVMQEGRALIRGRAAIQRDSEEQLKAAKISQMQGNVIEYLQSGEVGYVAYTGSHVENGTKRSWHGVTVYRQINGEWKAVVDASMHDSPPPAK